MKQQGVDLNLGYRFSTSFGDWRLGFDAAKILDLTRSVAPGLPYIDVLDTYSNPVDLRARASIGWRLNGWSTNAYLNYVDELSQHGDHTERRMWTATRRVDASIVYDFGEERGALSGVSLSVNGQNLLDEDPPVVLNGIVSWDNQNVSPLGRFVSFVRHQALVTMRAYLSQRSRATWAVAGILLLPMQFSVTPAKPRNRGPASIAAIPKRASANGRRRRST